MTATRWLVGAGLVVAVLALAALAPAARTTVAGSGVISGSGTSYTLTVTNSGSETIKCMRYFAPSGTSIPSATGPGSTASFGSGFGAQNLSLGPGQSATWNFTTSQAISASNNGALHLSADCVGDITGQLSGPTVASSPCNCISLNGRIVPKTIKITNPGEAGGIHLEFSVSWFMNCSAGTGGCNGQLELIPPQPAKKLKTRFKPISGRIDCATNCATNRSGVAHFTLIGGPALGNPKRLGKSFTITMKRTCQGKTVAPQRFVLVFNKIGLVDKARSRLK
jgi:hypothetical protein